MKEGEPQQNNLEKTPKLFERYGTLYQKIIATKDPALLNSLKQLNDEVNNHDYATREGKEVRERIKDSELSQKDIQELDYYTGHLDSFKEWLGYANNIITKIQAAPPGQDMSDEWESLINYTDLTLRNIIDIDI